MPGPGDVAIFDLGTAGYAVYGGLSGLSEIRVNNDTLTGLFEAKKLSIGHAAGSDGTVSLRGASLDVNVHDFPFPVSPAGGLWVGENGSGTLDMNSTNVNVTGQIVVADNEGAVGQITMDGAELGHTGGANLLSTTIARRGTGSLAATNGSRVNLTGTFVVGQDVGSQGMVTVDNSKLGTPGFGGTSLTSTTIGAAGTGSLAATNRSRVDLAGTFIVGQDAGSQGMVTVDDSQLGTPGFGGLDLTSTTIGAAGTGSLAATNRSRVDLGGTFVVGQDAGSQGVVTIDDSKLTGRSLTSTTIGAAGTGSLMATNGSQVDLGGTFVVGQDAGSQGMVTVDNSELGSRGRGLTSTTIGGAGYGSLAATNGAEVNLQGTFVIGQDAGSQGMVTVDNSKLGPPGFGGGLTSVTIGGAGYGSLAATNGAEVNFQGALVVGQDAGSQGMVTVDNSKMGTGRGLTSITIGGAGYGSLAATNGAEIEIESSLVVGQNDGSQGDVTIDNSFLKAREIIVGGSIAGPGGSGTFSVTGGALATASSIQVWSSGSVEIDDAILLATVVNNGVVHNNGILGGDFLNAPGGVLSGTGQIGGNVTLASGSEIVPGNSPGTLTLGNTDWFGGATFRFMINGAEGDAGSNPGWNSILTVGELSLFGSPTDPLRVSLVSLLPTNESGDVFDFNPEKSYSWTFATSTDGIFGFSPQNFIVDTTDFSNPLGSGFFEVRQMGNTLAVVYVPEPSTLILAVVGAVGLFARRARRMLRRAKIGVRKTG